MLNENEKSIGREVEDETKWDAGADWAGFMRREHVCSRGR